MTDGKQNEPKDPYAKVQRPTPPHAGQGGVSARDEAKGEGAPGGGSGTSVSEGGSTQPPNKGR